MELVVKHFSELSTEDLFAIYKLRVSVFVVEQKCPYQEIDDADKAAYHVWLQDENGIEAYARVLPEGATSPTVAIGRVIAVKRRCGLGSKIVSAAIKYRKRKVYRRQDHDRSSGICTHTLRKNRLPANI